ncbi:MAG TPA: bacterial transcriptional activator domain-containing protein [Blastocatellia bacterium]|nr:bacterial transcriptional activator domain-containing protein [Blastocatellia bacterium]
MASLLWGESSTAQSKKYLRHTLWQLQAACEMRLGFKSDRLIIADTNWVHLNMDVDLWTDVSEFKQSYDLLPSGAYLDDESAERLKLTVQLYRGDLLEGWYQDWCLFEREDLQNKYLAMLDKLILYCEAHCQYEAGLNHAARILQLDPARERTHQQMMRLYYFAGDRTAALRQYDSCVETLKKELDVSPMKGTLLLYEQIRADQLESTPQAHEPPPQTPPMPTSLTAVLSRLKELQGNLENWQRQIQQDIRFVEGFLPKARD